MYKISFLFHNIVKKILWGLGLNEISSFKGSFQVLILMGHCFLKSELKIKSIKSNLIRFSPNMTTS